MKAIKLTNQEQSIILDALNAYWNEAHENLDRNGIMQSNGDLRPLGDIEKGLLEQRKKLTHPLIIRFESA